jgi:hypothetical protein
LFPHIHWFQNQDVLPNFLIQYRWQINGEAKITSWSNLKLDSNVFTYVTGTLNQITTNLTGISPPVDAVLSDILQIRLIRDTNNGSTEFSGADTFSGNTPIMNLDIHYEINSLGSNTEYSK